MENKYPVRGKTAYRAGLALRAESAILSNGKVNLRALEKHLPVIFVRCVEEPGQSVVLGRVEFPQIKSSSLTREDPVEEDDLDYGDKFNLPVNQVFDAGLKSDPLCRIPP